MALHLKGELLRERSHLRFHSCFRRGYPAIFGQGLSGKGVILCLMRYFASYGVDANVTAMANGLCRLQPDYANHALQLA
jgi:hypothetical protein